MASRPRPVSGMERVVGSVAVATKTGALRIASAARPSKVIEVPSNISSARILKLPAGVVLLKSSIQSLVSGKSTAPSPKTPSIIKLQCVKSPEITSPAKKRPIVIFSGSKQGNGVSSEDKDTLPTGTVPSQETTEPPTTAAAGSEQKSKPKSWSREPRPLWKSKEPIVLYSGCKPENLEPKKKKDKAPESLPCPKKLQDILPQPWEYHISLFEELSNPENFKAEVRVNIFKKEDALLWLQEFEVASGTNFRIAKTFKENSFRIIFKKCYKCYKNTFRKDRIPRRENKRHLGCEARLIITIKNTDMKSSADLLLAKFPCVIGIYHNHCHSLATPDALRHRRPLPQVKDKLANMFRAKITPAAALRLHLSDLQREFGDKYSEVIQDGARCPTLSQCYRLYYEAIGNKVKDGKKRSSRRSSYKRKTTAATKNAPTQSVPETGPVIVNFNSADGVSTSFAISMNDKHESDEMQRSIKSLYEYEFMSNSNVVREDQLDNNIQIVNDNEIVLDSESIDHPENNTEDEEILDNEGTVAEEYIDNSEMLENVECEISNSSNTSNIGVNEEILCNTASLQQQSRRDVEQSKQDLLRIFNDISLKLESQPNIFISAVKEFTSQYDKCSGSQSELTTALKEFGANVPRDSSIVSSRGVSSLVEKLIDKGESTSVCGKRQVSGSPKRKVLVLRMDPNKFNQILGRVGNKDSKRELINI